MAGTSLQTGVMIPAFQGDSSNVDVALMCFGQAKTRLFRSGSIYLICLLDLVAGAGYIEAPTLDIAA